MELFTLVLVILILIIVLPLLSASIKIVREYERAVLFRLGKLVGAKGPGLFFIIPFVDSIVRTDLRIVTVDVPKQEVITRDNVSVKVDAVIYYRVADPISAVTKVANYHYAIALLGQTVLRDVLGQAELDDLLSKREALNKRIQAIIDDMTMPWGIKATAVYEAHPVAMRLRELQTLVEIAREKALVVVTETYPGSQLSKTAATAAVIKERIGGKQK
ncbi:MAG: membrane protease subunit, stomatin/prohibitin-like protein [Desulfurococcales archaeon ex4484_204]|nr:MAG: membrane protease subunit, stomatin/prohibitin-like protein [Desulfurococcales archaeon ex4484_204]